MQEDLIDFIQQVHKEQKVDYMLNLNNLYSYSA